MTTPDHTSLTRQKLKAWLGAFDSFVQSWSCIIKLPFVLVFTELP